MIEFCEHNQINGIKYHLEKSPDDGIATRIEQHKKSCNAIKDANAKSKDGCIVVNNAGGIIYIP